MKNRLLFSLCFLAFSILLAGCPDTEDYDDLDATQDIDATVDNSQDTTGDSTQSNVSIQAQCDVNGGSGANAVSINGTEFCSVSGAAPQLGSGTGSASCSTGDTVIISATCSATNCRVYADSVSGMTCPFTPPGFVNGAFGESSGFATSASVDCTCQ